MEITDNELGMRKKVRALVLPILRRNSPALGGLLLRAMNRRRHCIHSYSFLQSVSAFNWSKISCNR
jgi:hypothetical protein